MDLMMILHPFLLRNHNYDKLMMTINSNGRFANFHEGNNNYIATRAGATGTPDFSSFVEEKPFLYERIRRDVMASYPNAGPLKPRPSFPRQGSVVLQRSHRPYSNYDNKKRHNDCLIPGQFGHVVEDKKIDNVSSLSSYSVTEERKRQETKRRKIEIEGQNQQRLNPAAMKWLSKEYFKQEQLGRKDEGQLVDDDLQAGAFLLLRQKQKNQRRAGMEDLSSSYSMNSKAKTTQNNKTSLTVLEKDSSSVSRFAYIHRSDSIVDIHNMSYVDHSATIPPKRYSLS